VIIAIKEGILLMYKYAWWAEDSKGRESDLDEVGSRGQGGREIIEYISSNST